MSKKEQNAPQHIKRTTGDWIFDIAVIIFFCIFTFICIFPFYYLLINTISDNDLVTSGRVNFFPMLKNAEGNPVFGVQISNYVALRNVQDLGSSVLVTVARTLLGTALMVITSAWAGYLVTKQKMWKRSFWYRFLVVTMYFNAGLVPWYMNMLMMGLTAGGKRGHRRRVHPEGLAQDHPAPQRAHPGHHRHLRRGGQLELLPGFPAADEQPA